MVWEGLDAVKTGRVMLGATNPLASNPGEQYGPIPPEGGGGGEVGARVLTSRNVGTIRGDYALQVGMVSYSIVTAVCPGGRGVSDSC